MMIIARSCVILLFLMNEFIDKEFTVSDFKLGWNNNLPQM